MHPIRRADHSTQNDDTDDKAYNATTAIETHHTTLDAHNVTHTTNASAKQHRVKRGSHPAARRQRKRIAAARAAAAASESPPRLEETKSEQYNLPRVYDTRRSLDQYRTVATTVR